MSLGFGVPSLLVEGRSPVDRDEHDDGLGGGEASANILGGGLEAGRAARHARPADRLRRLVQRLLDVLVAGGIDFFFFFFFFFFFWIVKGPTSIVTDPIVEAKLFCRCVDRDGVHDLAVTRLIPQ